MTWVGALLLGSCTEDTFLTNLEDIPVSPYDTSTTQMRTLTYQVPPSAGSHSRLYVGHQGGFEMPFSLLTLGEVPALSDSVRTLDSAYVQLTVDTSRFGSPPEGSVFALEYVELDSNFSESGTNHSNVDWLPEAIEVFSSILTQDTAAGLPVIRFPVDTSWVNAWADTANPRPLLILKDVSISLWPTGVTAFHSSEAETHRPFLKIFSHDSSGSSDTTVSVTSDLTIIVPPSLESGSFDSLRVYAGGGAGLRSLIRPDLDSLRIPSEAVIIRANIILTLDTAASALSSGDDFQLDLLALSDSVDAWQWGQIHESDPYPGGLVSRGTVVDAKVALNVKNSLQFIVSGGGDNFGFKLVGSGSNFVFDYASFHTAPNDSLSPRLEVLYEAP
ncbi:MAG: hypothetical protein ACE5HZ_08170 [Fidelibacterota bacterium]